MTSTLLGIGNSPIPRRARQFLFAQGGSTGGTTDREVVLVGNMTSAGTATASTVNDPILSQADIDLRAGARSELRWMYYAYQQIDQGATVRFVPVVESAGTAATVVFTFTTTASDNTTMVIDWGGLRYYVPVTSGDTAIVQCAAAVAKINADPNLPFTAVQEAPANDHKMTLSAANKGPRGDYVLTAVRVSYLVTAGTTVAKAAVGSGTTADSFTLALAALAQFGEIAYHAAACTAVTTVTATDAGVGEYITSIRTQALPANGKDQVVHFGLDTSQANGTTVATSAAANSVYAKFVRVEGNDWSPPMVAAMYTAIHALEERQYAAANLAGYTTDDTHNFPLPVPYDRGNIPTVTEQTADLNNGLCCISWRPNGAGYIVRDITSYNYLGSSTTKDYRAREGHIASVQYAYWKEVAARAAARKQPNVADDPKPGTPPIPGYMYPRAVKALLGEVARDMCGPWMQNKPLLDTSVLDAMEASITVELGAAGFFASITTQPVRHLLFEDFLISQGGPAY